MAGDRDIDNLLRAPEQTLADELCSCLGESPIKLMSTGGIGFNPIHCLECNREVPPERLAISRALVQDVARWLRTYGAIDALELASGEYEAWARSQLLDLRSPPNVEGREMARRLNEYRRCYFWFFQPQGDDDFVPRTTCPNCDRPLDHHDTGLFPQLLCEHCDLVLTT
jgi:predicted  nucleic acid-binding Zn ribbon protein